MKFIIATILTALLAYAAGLFIMIPWWGFAIPAAIVGATIHQRPSGAFLSGFMSLFLLWGGLSFLLDYNNAHLLASRVSFILHLNGSYILVILVTAFIGGLIAGLSALTGCYIRKKKIVAE